MSAGTLKLTSNSTAVVGTSTLFTTDLKPGDFITATIGGVLYTLPVDTVTSNTAATLVSPFTGPTTTGAAWSAVPRKVLSQVTADLVAQTTAAMRGMNNDKANWQSFYSAAGDINITLPDGTKVPGPSWTKMAGLVSSSQQWRGNLPAAANLNAYGPMPDFTGTWNRSSNTNTTAEYGFPEDNAQGILEVFAGGRYGGMQRYTVSMNGNVYVRSLSGAWNGTDGPWSDWLPAGIQTRMSFFTGDLNTLKAPGEWSVTTPFTGGPTDIPGICEVIPRLNGTGLLQRYTAIATGAASINRTWQRTLSGTTWSGWDPVGIKPLNDLGIGIPNSTLSGLDWQTFSFVNGAAYQLNAANWLNAPSPLDTYTAGTFALNVTNVSGDVTASTGNAWIHFTATYYSAGLSRRIYQGVFRGPVGARVYHIEEIFTDSRVIPVANGGTGAATPAGARTALELGNSATRNVGSASGTVAAGDDSRLNTVGGKTGGSITGSITVGGPVMTAIDQGASLANKQGHVLVSRILTGSTPRCDALMYPFIDGNLVRQAAWAITSDNGTDQKTVVFNWANGALSVPGQVYPGSDIRHKTNIREVQNALEAVCNVRGVIYDKKDGGTEVGLIAQEVEKYCPEAIYESERKFFDDTVITDFKSLNVSGFSAAFAFAAIKELKAEVDELREQVAVQHAVLQSLVEEKNSQQLEIEALKSDMEELKKMVEGLIDK